MIDTCDLSVSIVTKEKGGKRAEESDYQYHGKEKFAVSQVITVNATAGAEMSVSPDNYVVPLDSCTSFPKGKSSLQGSSEGEDPNNGIQVLVVQRSNSTGCLRSTVGVSEWFIK
ncbi:MAG: hypothetical protein ACK53Y_09590, partial [bacterium]